MESELNDAAEATAPPIPAAWSWRALSWSAATSTGGDLREILALEELAGWGEADRERTLPLCWSWRAERWQRASNESIALPDSPDTAYRAIPQPIR